MKIYSAIPEPVSLAQALISYNTVNPPGQEEDCAKFIGNLLKKSGFTVHYYYIGKRRPNIVAHIKGSGKKAPLCFSGHTDTVPFDINQWNKAPLKGTIDNGKLYGRGASDMKGGIAAMVVAALRLAKKQKRLSDIMLIITAAEETACQGARYLVTLEGALKKAGALIIGEPTSNYPLVGHKGKLWLEAHAYGVSAHGSMPEKGVNAIYKAAHAVAKLEHYKFGISHPLMGAPTLNVGTISGGTSINMVPDKTVIGIDIRTVPGQFGHTVFYDLKSLLDTDVDLREIHDAPSVFTDPEDRWIQEVFDAFELITEKRPSPRCAPYFTDASALTPALGNPPTIILGPGEPDMAHKDDEFCYVSKIEEASEIYFEIGKQWIEN